MTCTLCLENQGISLNDENDIGRIFDRILSAMTFTVMNLIIRSLDMRVWKRRKCYLERDEW